MSEFHFLMSGVKRGDYVRIANEFEVSVSTVIRWASGKSQPGTNVRRLVQEFVVEKVIVNYE